ncbi:MAG: PLDc N-terminal domain-containing protein [Gemmatimonadetes bacterium]|nr:PLDc N-terminal domain-containing protein [Gemmatimonadota bacterium]MCK5489255.1 PLDc N-terminal domain-containing protein [Gemmatimonadota bacterium]
MLQTAWPFVAGTLAFLLSLIVSTHILLHKREVRAAVGWIGLAWLAPVVGSILYLVFGINRIKRRGSEIHASMDRIPVPRRLPPTLAPRMPTPPIDETLQPLARAVDRVTHNELTAGNRIEPLRNGDAAYPAMLDAIRGAVTSVALETYIFDMDRAGQEFVEELSAAVRRGVQVRVLIDGVGAAYSKPRAPAILRDRGVQVAQFGGGMVPWRMPYMNLRNHRKILVVDGALGFTGGMNIREGSYLKLDTAYPTRDLQFKLEGPVVSHLVSAFAQDWTHTTGEHLDGDLWCPPISPVGSSTARGVSDGPDDDFEKLVWTILAGLRAADRHVRIVTPYFLPDQALLTALNVVALSGVRLDIVLPETSNLRIVGWAMRAQLAQVMEYGARIWLSPAPFDHTKLMLVDDGWALFGSGNWDPRSLRLNFEFNVECYDPDLVSILDDIVAETIEDARPLSRDELDRRSLPIKLRDGAAWLFSPYL